MACAADRRCRKDSQRGPGWAMIGLQKDQDLLLEKRLNCAREEFTALNDSLSFTVCLYNEAINQGDSVCDTPLRTSKAIR